jgi:hypothetical protein
MKATNGIVSAPSSTHALSAFMAYEAECRKALQLLFVGLLNMAEGAGWSRRAAASALSLGDGKGLKDLRHELSVQQQIPLPSAKGLRESIFIQGFALVQHSGGQPIPGLV